MVPADLVFALAHLEFEGSTAVVRLDKDVRDYLIRALDRRHAARPHR
jgi:hypothetical protein